MVTRDRCALRRSTTTLLSPNRRVPSNTFKKESTCCCPDQMSYGFPRHADGSGLRVATTPFRKADATRRWHRVGVGRADKDFSRKTRVHNPGRSVAQEPHEDEASMPPGSPPTNMRHHSHEAAIVVSLKLPSRGLQDDCEE